MSDDWGNDDAADNWGTNDDNADDGWGNDDADDNDGWGNGDDDDNDDNKNKNSNNNNEWEATEDDDQDTSIVDDPKIRVENAFYEAEDSRRRDPQRALELFTEAVELAADDPSMLDKRFKALEHIVTINLALKQFDQMVQRYKELLSLAQDVTRNESSESINSVLNAAAEANDSDMLASVYSVTLETLKTIPGQERMWFNISMKLCKHHLEKKAYSEVTRMLNDLHATCRAPDGSDDMSKGGQLLEIYAIQIQMLMAQGDSLRLKDLFNRTQHLSAEINDPRSMSVIQQCYGKMYASQGKWEEAYGQFWESFKQFQEIGNHQATQCLKYVVIMNMLSGSAMNPFDSREAKVYQNNPEIEAIVSLRRAYDDNDIRQFQRILKVHHNKILNDPFIEKQLQPLMWNVRSQALVQMVAPYSRVKLDSIASYLNVDRDEVEALLVSLILDGTLSASIDQVQGLLILRSSGQQGDKKYKALDRWSSNIGQLEQIIASRCGQLAERSGSGGGGGGGGRMGTRHGAGMFGGGTGGFGGMDDFGMSPMQMGAW